MTPEQRAALQAWKDAQGINDTRKLTRKCNMAQDGDLIEPPPIVTDREAYELEVAIRDIVVARYGPLAQYAGLSPRARMLLLKTNIRAAYDAGEADAKMQALLDGQEIKTLNDMAKELDGGMSHAEFLQPTHSTPQMPYNEALPSVAQNILGREVTWQEIEEVMK